MSKHPNQIALAKRRFGGHASGIEPVLKQLHSLLKERPGYVTQIYNRAGVDVQTPRRWFRRGSPTIASLTAILNTMGYDLTIERKTK
jgi:DNA-binding phage protein